MAKKKSKKNTTRLICSIVVIALAVLTICTLFMPVFTSTTKALGGAVQNNSHIKGVDVISALFNGKVSTDLSAGTNALISLKNADDTSFVGNVFIWTYFLTIVVSCASLVFALLSILGMKFRLINTLLGVAVIVLALVAFIFSFIVAKKFGSVDMGNILQGNTKVAIGLYLFIASWICGATEVYLAKS